MLDIEISDEVFKLLAEHRQGFETPNEVIQRILSLSLGNPTVIKTKKNRTKKEVISFLSDKGLSYENSCLHFSNINKAKPVFWVDIPTSKFDYGKCKELTLVLNYLERISLLEIPISFFKENIDIFYKRTQQNGTDYITLELNKEFKDIKSQGSNYDFTEFLKASYEF